MIDEEFFRFAGCQVKKKTYICSMIPPRIEQSTKEERRAFVMEAWKCLNDCDMDVTLDIRNNNYGR